MSDISGYDDLMSDDDESDTEDRLDSDRRKFRKIAVLGIVTATILV